MAKLYHQIWHGDAVEMCRKFKPGRVDCIITDPPFGIDNLSNSSVTEAGKSYARKIANDDSPEKAIKLFHEVMGSLAPATAEDCDMYIFTASAVLKEWLQVAEDLAEHGFIFKEMLIWDKDGSPGQGDLNSWGRGYEVILFLKKGKKIRQAKRTSAIITQAQLRPGSLIHPHEKPEPLLERLIKFSTEPGDFIVDPFGGSGSLVRAARNVDRSAVAIELDERNYRESLRKLEENQGLFV